MACSICPALTIDIFRFTKILHRIVLSNSRKRYLALYEEESLAFKNVFVRTVRSKDIQGYSCDYNKLNIADKNMTGSPLHNFDAAYGWRHLKNTEVSQDLTTILALYWMD